MSTFFKLIAIILKLANVFKLGLSIYSKNSPKF